MTMDPDYPDYQDYQDYQDYYPAESGYPATPARSPAQLFVPISIGIAVSVALGVYGNLHQPTGIAVSVSGFSSPQTVKVWLASAAGVLVVVQLVSALVMYGKLPGVRAPEGIGTLHRWSGRIAFLLTVPVAVHCLYALGFATFDTRTLAHSLAGCFFFGAFTVKMLILPRRGVPGWALPLFGGLVFTALAVLWLTSSFWFFTTVGVKL
jgi:hypothetical protein